MIPSGNQTLLAGKSPNRKWEENLYIGHFPVPCQKANMGRNNNYTSTLKKTKSIRKNLRLKISTPVGDASDMFGSFVECRLDMVGHFLRNTCSTSGPKKRHVNSSPSPSAAQMGFVVKTVAKVPRLVTAEPVVRGQSVGIGRQNSAAEEGTCWLVVWNIFYFSIYWELPSQFGHPN